MTGQFLTLRLNETEAELLARLGASTGLTKTEIVKRALRGLAKSLPAGEENLFELGAARFGRHGDDARQAADIKRVVRARLDAKRTG
jgi:hypothetical protein